MLFVMDMELNYMDLVD